MGIEPEHRLDHSPFIVKPGSQHFRLSEYDPAYAAGFESKEAARRAMLDDTSSLADAQARLWAAKEFSVLIILQALDAAGKDGAIKHVMTGVNPQGCDVHAFGPPSEQERLHHFLWRPMQYLPERGRISIFNRSYYEEVLVVRVHPEWLDKQWTPVHLRGKQLEERWRSRYQDINEFEHRLHRHGLVIIKFFLNLSYEEQRERLIKRLDNPDKNWKFNESDLTERGHWDAYREAFEDMLRATSTQDAPWYIIPADRKWFARAAIADVITSRLNALDLQYPKPDPGFVTRIPELRAALEGD